jgi:hypothetical protein
LSGWRCNHADVQARDYPLTRRKYALLLLIAAAGAWPMRA